MYLNPVFYVKLSFENVFDSPFYLVDCVRQHIHDSGASGAGLFARAKSSLRASRLSCYVIQFILHNIPNRSHKIGET
jgi:hypothetical protein